MRREQWRKVLDAEYERWSALSYEELLSSLRNMQAYEVDFERKQYQVEVQILEHTARHVHVVVSVDDGSLPASILPLTRSFVRSREETATD